jgi:ABC-type Mn2+/Zn2+ transport system ATPase subunit
MPLTKFEAENFTVFKKISISFNSGLNVFVGENGVGKTHIMKLAYAACQASKHDVSFAQKTTMVFRPDQSSIGRLVKRGKDNTAKVTVCSDTSKIGMTFSMKTTKWDADVKAESSWEKQMSELTSIFIPAKEIMSNAWNLDAAVKMGNVEFDDTYLDIIAAAKIDISGDSDINAKKKYLDILQKISLGKVTVQDDRFYLRQGNQAKLEFNLVAEGLRKIALLWKLIKNGALEKGAVLFWDEPEANINPIHIPILAELLIMLEQEGVQIFVSTHDYFLAKYIEIKRQKESRIQYISLYEDEEDKQIKCETENEFALLEHNAIMETFRKLYKEEVGVILQ